MPVSLAASCELRVARKAKTRRFRTSAAKADNPARQKGTDRHDRSGAFAFERTTAPEVGFPTPGRMHLWIENPMRCVGYRAFAAAPRIGVSSWSSVTPLSAIE